jgi:hypothetical protein
MRKISLEEIKWIAEVDFFIALRAAEMNHKIKPDGIWIAVIGGLELHLLDKLHYLSHWNDVFPMFLKVMLGVWFFKFH